MFQHLYLIKKKVLGQKKSHVIGIVPMSSSSLATTKLSYTHHDCANACAKTFEKVILSYFSRHPTVVVITVLLL